MEKVTNELILQDINGRGGWNLDSHYCVIASFKNQPTLGL